MGAESELTKSVLWRTLTCKLGEIWTRRTTCMIDMKRLYLAYELQCSGSKREIDRLARDFLAHRLSQRPKLPSSRFRDVVYGTRKVPVHESDIPLRVDLINGLYFDVNCIGNCKAKVNDIHESFASWSGKVTTTQNVNWMPDPLRSRRSVGRDFVYSILILSENGSDTKGQGTSTAWEFLFVS